MHTACTRVGYRARLGHGGASWLRGCVRLVVGTHRLCRVRVELASYGAPCALGEEGRRGGGEDGRRGGREEENGEGRKGGGGQTGEFYFVAFMISEEQEGRKGVGKSEN